ncbi:putative zinc-binding metallopeptidase [Prevotella sp. AGR2160]|uniref:zinc-binding metallopeptidase n=1 Tax=Prevotella sp. AGR2160 TaxID=1280674 RepID=UPI0003FCDE77|nr:putative zinc-binding metallopeptidase [Prevotella sp. AGR2160]
MKKLVLYIFLMGFVFAMAGCSNDDIDETNSVFTHEKVDSSEFDHWLAKNYTQPYNIRPLYRYHDLETDNSYNVIPAKVKNVQALAVIMKHIWLDAYAEVAGPDFLKKYCPRIFQFIGSGEYNSNGSVVLGTAEGGMKITLFRVNAIDPDNIFIDSVSAVPQTEHLPLDLNYWYFHTMHHEFCHILTQHKNYSTDFQLVSAGKYHSSDWVNVKDEDAPALGFVSGYASGEYNEDFAEIYSTYVTHTQEAWDKLLALGVKNGDTSGRDAIVKKLAIIKEYFKSSYGLDIDKLREVVLRRCHEVQNMDLSKLN